MQTPLLSKACLPLLTAFVAIAGCTQDPGNVEVPFSIGASSVTCESADVATVEMVLTQVTEEGSDEALEYMGTAACADGSVTFTGIAADNYDLEVRAISSDGLTVFDNFDPDALNSVEALAGQDVTTDTVRLDASPARILVRWQLTKGGAQVQCTGVETKQFEVSAYDEGGFKTLLVADPIDCDAEPAESPFHVVADPERTLDGTDVREINVVAQDAQGNPVGPTAEILLDTSPGRGVSIKVVVDCIDDECTASVDP